MKMFDKNGKLTIVAKMVFDQNMERLRAGDSPLEIAKTLHEQLKLVEYNGQMIDSSGAPTIWFWSAFKIGKAKWDQSKPVLKLNPIFAAIPSTDIRALELNKYLGAYHIPNGTRPNPIIAGTINA